MLTLIVFKTTVLLLLKFKLNNTCRQIPVYRVLFKKKNLNHVVYKGSAYSLVGTDMLLGDVGGGSRARSKAERARRLAKTKIIHGIIKYGCAFYSRDEIVTYF